MPCLVRNREGRWTIVSGPKAIAFASATLNAMAANRAYGLHTGALYSADDEDAEAILERLSAAENFSASRPTSRRIPRARPSAYIACAMFRVIYFIQETGMAEVANDTLSVCEASGDWFDTSSADLQEAARQFAAYKGWAPDSWSASRVPPTKASLVVAFRRFRTYGRFGASNRSRIEVQTDAAGFVVPPAGND